MCVCVCVRVCARTIVSVRSLDPFSGANLSIVDM